MQNPENKQPAQQPRGIEHLLSLEQRCQLNELIFTGQAAFEFIRFSRLDSGFKNAFHQLEKLFDHYKCVLINEPS